MEEKRNGRNVVVVGAGLVGVCTAHYLWKAGYNVTVVDECSQVADATSFANAGRFCPTRISTYPLASPGVLRNLVTYPFRKAQELFSAETSQEVRELTSKTEDVPSSIQPSFALMSWGLWFLRNCTQGRYAGNNIAFRQMTLLSKESTEELVREMPGDGWAKIDRREDNLWVYGSSDAAKSALSLAQAASWSGFHNWEWLECNACKSAFPSLAKFLDRVDKAPGMKPSCIVAHDDYSVDARKFSEQVSQLSRRSKTPVNFLFNTRAVGFRFDSSNANKIEAVQCERIDPKNSPEGTSLVISADHVVVCCGPQARAFVKETCGKNLYIQGMKGGSVELYGVKNGPETAIADYLCGSLNYQATPFGNGRVRLIGFADFVPLDSVPSRPLSELRDPLSMVKCEPHYLDKLLQRTKMVFPDMTWESTRQPWCGIRPLTPDGLPMVGKLNPFENLWLNVGHGSIGWSFAAGTAFLGTREIMRADQLLSPHSIFEKRCLRFGFGSADSLSPNRFSLGNFFALSGSSSQGSSF